MSDHVKIRHGCVPNRSFAPLCSAPFSEPAPGITGNSSFLRTPIPNRLSVSGVRDGCDRLVHTENLFVEGPVLGHGADRQKALFEDRRSDHDAADRSASTDPRDGSEGCAPGLVVARAPAAQAKQSA